MASTSRTIFVLIPFILNLITLVLLILIFTGNTSSSSSITRSLYFIRADTPDSVLAQAAGALVKDWYTIGLWNYCSGSAGSSTPTHCSPTKAFYWFDPLQVWHLRGTPVASFITSDWESGLDAYHSASKWLFIAYIAAIGASAATLIVSACAFCRRLGSAITSLVAIAASLFTIAAAVTATLLYKALQSFIASKLGTYGLTASLGSAMFTLNWLAVGTSAVACMFFIGTACCCSGERRENERAEGGTKAYERVPSPYGARSPVLAAPAHWGGYQQHEKAGFTSVPMHPYHQYHESY